jgi:hypothetical protein
VATLTFRLALSWAVGAQRAGCLALCTPCPAPNTAAQRLVLRRWLVAADAVRFGQRAPLCRT